MNSEVFCIVKVITGKGLHSKCKDFNKLDGKSILKPTVISWSEAKGLQCTVSDDSIDVYFRLL